MKVVDFGLRNILKDVHEGDPISVYNVLNYNKFSCHGVQEEDELFVVYRTPDGEKHVQAIKDPDYEFYAVRPEYRKDFITPREYLEIEKTYPIKVPARAIVSRLYKEIRTFPDPVDHRLCQIYDNAVATGNWKMRKQIMLTPYVLMADIPVDSYYWIQLGTHYDLTQSAVTDICFGDIENDIYGLTSTEQALNLDPVNAMTMIFQFDPKSPYHRLGTQVFTYLLRNHKRYPQQADFEKNLDKFYAECHEKFDHQTIIKKGKKKVIDTLAEYHIRLFDTEEELLHEIFRTVNRYKPDFMEFWNMPYDMPKMAARMENLGMDPIKEMSDGDFFDESVQHINWHIDNRPIDIAERNSYIRMTSTTQYIDQMQNYAGIRKGRKSYGSNKLDNIAKIELGMGKWEFRKGIDVTNACILDYWNFVLYNIRDVWCQVLINQVTNDTMSLVYDMNYHQCPLHHLVKQTKYQKQIYYAGYMRRGFVPGHNINVNYTQFGSDDEAEKANEARRRRALRIQLDRMGMDEDDAEELLAEGDAAVEEVLSEDGGSVDDVVQDAVEAETAEVLQKTMAAQSVFEDSIDRKLPLPGGLVGNPNNNSANGLELIEGVPSKHFFDEVMDEDYSSEYPWAKYTRSLSRSTQIGRLIIPHKVSKYQNMLPLGQIKRKEDTRYYIPGAEFTSDYISQDWLSLGAAWFNLPLTDEMNRLVDLMADGMSYDDAEKRIKELDLGEEG